MWPLQEAAASSCSYQRLSAFIYTMLALLERATADFLCAKKDVENLFRRWVGLERLRMRKRRQNKMPKSLHKLYIRILFPHYYILNDIQKAAEAWKLSGKSLATWIGALEGTESGAEICFFIARRFHPPPVPSAVPDTPLIQYLSYASAFCVCCDVKNRYGWGSFGSAPIPTIRINLKCHLTAEVEPSQSTLLVVLLLSLLKFLSQIFSILKFQEDESFRQPLSTLQVTLPRNRRRRHQVIIAMHPRRSESVYEKSRQKWARREGSSLGKCSTADESVESTFRHQFGRIGRSQSSRKRSRRLTRRTWTHPARKPRRKWNNRYFRWRWCSSNQWWLRMMVNILTMINDFCCFLLRYQSMWIKIIRNYLKN